MVSGKNCRVCNSKKITKKFQCEEPSITSIKTVMPVNLSVYCCEKCGHFQKPNLIELAKYYDTDYKISMESAGHDQVYKIKKGSIIYRVDQQVNILKNIELGLNSKVLDFGSGKGVTTQRFWEFRKDINPHVYDVSRDYKSYWDTWLPNEKQSIYTVPSAWFGSFDLITSFFVFEHLQDPFEKLLLIKKLLKDKALFLMTVPNATKNTGDMLVADHINHFNEESLKKLFSRAGFKIEELDKRLFDGAYVVLVRNTNQINEVLNDLDIQNVIKEYEKNLKFWEEIIEKLDNQTIDPPAAIYGAGFYGALASIKLKNKHEVFLDRNDFLDGQQLLDIPIKRPEDCPSNIKTIVVGLNPFNARKIISENDQWIPKGAKVLYLDD